MAVQLKILKSTELYPLKKASFMVYKLYLKLLFFKKHVTFLYMCICEYACRTNGLKNIHQAINDEHIGNLNFVFFFPHFFFEGVHNPPAFFHKNVLLHNILRN